MTTVTGISANPKQKFTLALDDGTQVSCSIEYRPQQQSWFADVQWETWVLNGLRLVPSPNLLRQWRNVIPFGFALLTGNQREISSQQAFASGAAELILLNAADVARFEELAYDR